MERSSASRYWARDTKKRVRIQSPRNSLHASASTLIRVIGVPPLFGEDVLKVGGQHFQFPAVRYNFGMPPATKKSKRYLVQCERRTYELWEKEFNRLLTRGSNADEAFRRWIKCEDARRKAYIAEIAHELGSRGIGVSGLKLLPQPENARADLMRRLYRDSVPNVQERTRARVANKKTLADMEKLAKSVDRLIALFEKRGPNIWSQDETFKISLTRVLQSSIRLSSSIRFVIPQIKRSHIYPLDIADCCTLLVMQLEDRNGLTERECHALIRCALVAHGCDKDVVAELFGEGSVERGTIGAKKTAFRQRLLKSAAILAENPETLKAALQGATLLEELAQSIVLERAKGDRKAGRRGRSKATSLGAA